LSVTTSSQLITTSSHPYSSHLLSFTLLPFNTLTHYPHYYTSISIHDTTGKIIGLYFSAHWCGPCRSFTPQLVEKYLAIKAAGYAFEIIFLSSDEDEESAMEYFKTMPWLMIKFEDRSLDEELSREFDISGNHLVAYCLLSSTVQI
jgi:thiol-disulfide isomerase/thioredoxin